MSGILDMIIRKINNKISENTLINLFLEKLTSFPNRTAVSCMGNSLTYMELTDRLLPLAAYLQHKGIRKDECVGIYVEPSLDLMIGIWGILFSGAAYLPLAPEYPAERIRFMVLNTKVKIIFSQEKLREQLKELLPNDIEIITEVDLKKFATINNDFLSYPHPNENLSNHLAYVIYTSGSTGQPKGVMIEHYSITNQLRWMSSEFNLNEFSTVLQKTPISFDAAQWEILAVCCGSHVVIGAPGIYRDPDRLIHSIINKNIHVLQCVPTLLQALVDNDKFIECKSLKQIFCGGEVLSKKLAIDLFNVMPEVDLINLYGPTECTINASAYQVDKNNLHNMSNALSIGKPVLNTHFYVLDNNKNIVDDNQIGELYIGGDQLARGYFNRIDLTLEKFISYRFNNNTRVERLYRTGDLVCQMTDGTFQFFGRIDNQIKLRGFRIELDEIKLAIEKHEWVKYAGIVVKTDSNTGFQKLIACVELNTKEAALMDQGNHDQHHQSKENKLQVKMQLSHSGCRSDKEIRDKFTIKLPFKNPTKKQRALAFARKTYRFYEGGLLDINVILQLLKNREIKSAKNNIASFNLIELGHILRNFGQFISKQRLLPKYAYASPGALYATQLYLAINNVAGIPDGYYYYHPIYHQLYLINTNKTIKNTQITVTFIGKKSAIESIYKNNILEVLEIEAGHMLGLFDLVLPKHSLKIGKGEYCPEIKNKLYCADEDYYLGTFPIITNDFVMNDEYLDIYIQSHESKVNHLPAGLYQYTNGNLDKVSNDVIQKKHVIAINQSVYEKASFGIILISRNSNEWLQYIELGRKLQHLQMNQLKLGLMSSGYSSKSGDDLPSAKPLQTILKNIGRDSGPFYFCIGGLVSDAQITSDGMNEDIVHAKGPSELLKDDLSHLLPDFMIPNKIMILDHLPQTVNGKIDYKTLEKLLAREEHFTKSNANLIAPRNREEAIILDIWKKIMKIEEASVTDNFFDAGGNSLLAMILINEISKKLGCEIPAQILFETPTIEKLALTINNQCDKKISRIIPLSLSGTNAPIFCWPGLGGYPMNLRLLANHVRLNRPFYGIQASGLNNCEIPGSSIITIAVEDIKAIKKIQANGPYTLWGYSFGAKIAFEAAYQLEEAGEIVENLFLIAPGSPRVDFYENTQHLNKIDFTNKNFISILYSVFAKKIKSKSLDECLNVVKDEKGFIDFICVTFKNLDRTIVKRIVNVVCKNYNFQYTDKELFKRNVRTPITIIKAKGDETSFFESHFIDSINPPTTIELPVNHYDILKKSGVEILAETIHQQLTDISTTKKINGENNMPHINIKHFPINLSLEQKNELIRRLTESIQNVFGCQENVISIALEPINKELWQEQVYIPEIQKKWDLLCKIPNY